ncbi:beta-ketoacyl synthase N-terminal-like domain-containing protein [Paenibacillus qinlingensis]|uniref:beta-ketoacyl synthase N-terminal-like domain-containing protein n=1 Tax=Paenibacillus qinlingensis TaxID=1837343 RepID=UPI0015669D13|nr:beta-ketoacyl synthase N-terminal-like domain-containing protein [Paenibacillus qinlingensis]NQX57961.1 polyketide synthase dehydratase domain-containing protein [Paenibacillus qinlingensis]
MKSFEPIAIVGMGCVFPDAFNPDQFWEGLKENRNLLSDADAETFRVAMPYAVADETGAKWPVKGGYIRHFPACGPRTEPQLQWSLASAQQALTGVQRTGIHSDRQGLIMGNLSLPTRSFARYAESVWTNEASWLGQSPQKCLTEPMDRLMSGYPAHYVAEQLGLTGSAFCLDAACASSLYAIKLACDRLQLGKADLMLAGAVNGTDPLFLHIGFRALKALSLSGQSRPFHPQADGLVPAEGAGFVALKRLSDAEASGDRILAVIRGIGLSNDGGSGSLMAPSAYGQQLAMRKAYQSAGIEPAQVSYVECHATGTPVGDAIEIGSMKDLFAETASKPAIGSLKSNVGHLMTASGIASIIKVIKGMEHSIIPATLHLDDALPDAQAERSFRIVNKNETWRTNGAKIAAVNSFGFGGNNAHLILEEYTGPEMLKHTGSKSKTATTPQIDIKASALVTPIAVVGIGVITNQCNHVEDLLEQLLHGKTVSAHPIAVWGERFAFPPNDLRKALPQQLMMLGAVHEALCGVGQIPPDNTGYFVGMQCDSDIARHIARIRVQDWARLWAEQEGEELNDEWIDLLKNAFASKLDGATVLGLLPNIPANRLNKQYQSSGPGFTVSSEQLSGIRALEIAMTALRTGELDAAVVGAVDASAEPVQQAALKALLGEAVANASGDAAVALVLKRLSDAEAQGDDILAVLSGEVEASINDVKVDTPTVSDSRSPWSGLPIGYAHAASGLVEVMGAALSCACGVRLDNIRQQLDPSGIDVRVEAIGGQLSSLRVEPYSSESPFHLFTCMAPDKEALIQRLRSHQSGGDGGIRVAIAGSNRLQLKLRMRQALQLFESGCEPDSLKASGISFSSRSIQGELAIVYTGAAAAYMGMGAEWFPAFPNSYDRTVERFGTAMKHVKRVLDAQRIGRVTPFEKLCAASFLCHFHTAVSRDVLGLKPAAVIGLSSGETNALSCWGAWDSAEGLFADLEAEEVYTRWLAGENAVLADQWGAENACWVNWRLLHPVTLVQRATAEDPEVEVTTIHTDGDCVIGGHPDACKRLIEKLGKPVALPLEYDMVIHTAMCQPFAETWRKIHRRPTTQVEDIRFYSCSTYDHYRPEMDASADALTRMATQPIDFRKLILKAYEDGVRVFIEHGPRNVCSGWIKEILGEREHVAIAFDHAGKNFLEQWAHVLAQLAAAGIAVDSSLYREYDGKEYPMKSLMTVPLHAEAIVLPEPPARAYPLPPAPSLPRVLDLYAQEADEVRASMTSLHGQQQQPAAVLAAAGKSSTEGAGYKGPLLHDILQLHQEVSRAHQSYVMQMSQVYQSYLHAASGGRQRVRASEVHMPFHPVRTTNEEVSAVSVWQQAILETAAAAAPADAEPAETPSREGQLQESRPLPAFDRGQLKVLASGRISDVFGPLFVKQDGYEIQVRMPEPPLLLADRVTGIEGEPGVLGKGTIWTETDVQQEAWYLHQGRMPFGILVESGQADLLLVSWQGIDFHNQGQRMYRLLGCELTFFGPLPQPGETLRYEIHIDGHAQLGDTRIFFFHYDLYVEDVCRMSMRGGQAGFFSWQELQTSKGVLWNAETGECLDASQARVDAPSVLCEQKQFSQDQLIAFSEGRLSDCFGPAFRFADTHVRSPRIQDGQMLLLQRVTEFDSHGGPWERGYLAAETTLQGNEWFFPCHFKGDPAMPGTLMLEGCIQAMSFYLSALGYTLNKDGWRFEPSTGDLFKMVCRGQITPESRHLIYEVFVEEVWDGPIPTLYADVLLTVDGLKAFHCRRLGLKLLPDYPLDERYQLLEEVKRKPGGYVYNGFTFDYASLLACAWGKPSEAFGPKYIEFDGLRSLPRLPGPPYHFMSRIHHIEGDLDRYKDVVIEAEYDIPLQDEWYFSANPSSTMPVSVLMEAALQPCGWLTALIGIPLTCEKDLSFRNLDGKGTMHQALVSGGQPLRTRVKLLSVSRMGNTYIEAFEVTCTQDGRPIFDMHTVFGHFPHADLASQAGLPSSESEREMLVFHNSDYDLMDVEVNRETLRGLFPEAPLLMIDRITGYIPVGGRHGAGCVIAEKTVLESAWFFKAHFYEDPVQPGSLGIEAMLQTLQWYMLAERLDQGMRDPAFEPMATGVELEWKYRGQVLPKNNTVNVLLQVKETVREKDSILVLAEASLWVDGMKIYEASRVGMRLTDRAADQAVWIDPEQETWLVDHCPTHSVAAYPFMFMADLIACRVKETYPDQVIIGMSEVQVHRWLVCETKQKLIVELELVHPSVYHAVISVWREASKAALSRYEPLMTAEVRLGQQYEAGNWKRSIDELAQPREVGDPYQQNLLFHGPSLQAVRELTYGDNGSSVRIASSPGVVPLGVLNPVLLDALTHAIPHETLSLWSQDALPDTIAYPYQLTEACFFATVPSEGSVNAEVRFAGFRDENPRFPQFVIRVEQDGRPIMELMLTEICFPKGKLGRLNPADRKQFLLGQGFVEEAQLSEEKKRNGDGEGILLVLTVDMFKQQNWLPGTLEKVYRLPDTLTDQGKVKLLLIKELAARSFHYHPAEITVEEVNDSEAVAYPSATPFRRMTIRVEKHEKGFAVSQLESEMPEFTVDAVKSYWQETLGQGQWLIGDLFQGLGQQFVGDYQLDDPEAFQAMLKLDRPALYLANHQTAIESLLFIYMTAALTKRPMSAIAKAEHSETWIGRLLSKVGEYPGLPAFIRMFYFDRSNQSSMLELMKDLKGQILGEGLSMLVHLEGTRALQAGQPVSKISSVFLDLALELDLPIVPVRFAQGLPLIPLEHRTEFPYRYGKQTFHLGRPILPEQLKSLSYADRTKFLLDKLNAVGGAVQDEQEPAGDCEFASEVRIRLDTGRIEEPYAVLQQVLLNHSSPSQETVWLLGEESGDVKRQVENVSTVAGAWLQDFRNWLYRKEQE